jgi:glycosyltransferase involved in cell wall biosynthesis
LLKAYSKLPNRENYRLIIVGDGPLALPLKVVAQELGISEQVDFVGYDSNPYRYMSRADLFILSSKWEGLANVLIEAMACGCSVVSTDCPYGPREILEDGKYGVLVPVEGAQELTNAIYDSVNGKRAHVDPADLRRRANYFTDRRATNAYVELINSLLPRNTVKG